MDSTDPIYHDSGFDNIISTLHLQHSDAPFSFDLQPLQNLPNLDHSQHHNSSYLHNDNNSSYDETDIEDDDQSLINIANHQRSRLLPNIRTKGEEKIDLSSFQSHDLDGYDDGYLSTQKSSRLSTQKKRLWSLAIIICLVVGFCILFYSNHINIRSWTKNPPNEKNAPEDNGNKNDNQPDDVQRPINDSNNSNKNSENAPKEPKSPPRHNVDDNPSHSSNGNGSSIPDHSSKETNHTSHLTQYTHPNEKFLCYSHQSRPMIQAMKNSSWFRMFPVSSIQKDGNSDICFTRDISMQPELTELIMKTTSPILSATPINSILLIISKFLKNVSISAQVDDLSLKLILNGIDLPQPRVTSIMLSQIQLIHSLLSKHSPMPTQSNILASKWKPLLNSQSFIKLIKQKYYNSSSSDQFGPTPLPSSSDCSLHGCCSSFVPCFQTCLNSSSLTFNDKTNKVELISMFTLPTNSAVTLPPLFIINNNMQTLESPWIYHQDVLNQPLYSNTIRLNKTIYNHNNNHSRQRVYQSSFSQSFDHPIFTIPSIRNNNHSMNKPTTIHQMPESVHTHLLHSLCTLQCNTHTRQSLRNGNTFQSTPFFSTLSTPNGPNNPPKFQATNSFSTITTIDNPNTTLQPGFCHHSLHRQFIHDLLEASTLASRAVTIDSQKFQNPLNTPNKIPRPYIQPSSHLSTFSQPFHIILGEESQSCHDVCSSFTQTLWHDDQNDSPHSFQKVQSFSSFDIFLSPPNMAPPPTNSPYRYQCFESLFPILLHSIQQERMKPKQQLPERLANVQVSPLLLYHSKYTTQPYISVQSPLLADFPTNALQQEKTNQFSLPPFSQHTKFSPLFSIHDSNSNSSVHNNTTTPSIIFPPFVSPSTSLYLQHFDPLIPSSSIYPSTTRSKIQMSTLPHESDFLHLVTWDIDDLSYIYNPNISSCGSMAITSAKSPHIHSLGFQSISEPILLETKNTIWSALANVAFQYDCRVSSPFQRRICPCLRSIPL